MRVYVAAAFGQLSAARKAADRIREEGHEVTADWLYLEHPAPTQEEKTEWALKDLRDVDRSDAVVLLSLPDGVEITSGGRYVELGYAIARRKIVVVVGKQETVFHWLPQVNRSSSIDDALEYLYDCEHGKEGRCYDEQDQAADRC